MTFKSSQHFLPWESKAFRVVVVIGVFFVLNLIGAAVITQLEQLNYLDGFYQMMMASTTIGFGPAPQTDGGKMFVSFVPLFTIGLFFAVLFLIF